MAAEVRKRKLRPWAEAARLVLGSQESLTITEIFERIIERGLRDTTPGSKECLFSMLRAHSRGQHSLFYRKIDDENNISFGLRSDLPPSTVIIETDVDTDEESQKHDSRFKPKIQLLKIVIESETENVAPAGIIAQMPAKRKPVEELLPPPKRCLRPKPQRTSGEGSIIDDRASTSSDGTLSPTSSEDETDSSVRRPIILSSFQTLREMMNNLSDNCGIRFNRRPSKKSSMSQQLEETRKGFVDLETPESILVNVNIKELLSNYAFSLLDRSVQLHLLRLLPQVDQKRCSGVDSALNNEFFASACQEWRERLMDGDLAPESQLKQKADYDRHLKSVDSWKRRHFEEVWGSKSKISVEDQEFYERMVSMHKASIQKNEVNSNGITKKRVVPPTNDRLAVETPTTQNGEAPPPPPTEVKVKRDIDDTLAEEQARMALLLPYLSPVLHQALAEFGVPVSSNHRRKCNNIVPPSLCLSAKRIGINLLPPPRVYLHAPIGIPRKRLRFYHHQAMESEVKAAAEKEASKRFQNDFSQLENNLELLDRYMNNPSIHLVPLDVQEVMTDIVNLVDLDRISDYPVYTSNSYATSTIGTPSHAGTNIDEICGSELMFSVTTDEESPTDDMSDLDNNVGSELSGSRPHTAIDPDGLLYMDLLPSREIF